MGNQIPQQGLHGKENCTKMKSTKVQNPQPIFTHKIRNWPHHAFLAVLTGGASSCSNISYVRILGECSAFLVSGSEPTGAGLNTPTCAGSLVSAASQCY